MTSIKLLTPALALAAVIAAPGEAEACDPGVCHNVRVVDGLTPVNAALIPGDGALVLRATGQFLGDTWSDAVTLAVSLDGQPVAGALETVPQIGDALLWRSAAALAPGTYTVTGTVDNADGDDDYCGDDLDLEFEFAVDAGPSTPLIEPEVSASEVVTQSPSPALTALVCCEGVAPTQFMDSCGGVGSPAYPEGQCGVTQGTGTLSLTLDVAPKLPVATVGLLAYTLIVDGEPRASTLTPQLKHDATTPVCTQVKITNLATGESTTTAEQCHGAANADEIGPQQLDPAAELTCDGPLQTCELDATGESWDLTKCTPWPAAGETGAPTEGGSDDSAGEADSAGSGTDPGQEPGGDKGCACDSDDAGAPWQALALVGLLALRRRSRRGAQSR